MIRLSRSVHPASSHYSLRRYISCWQTVTDKRTSGSGELKLLLSEAEQTALQDRIVALAQDNPAVARELLKQITEVEFKARSSLNLPAMAKVAAAKQTRLSGQGKTMLFAYLSLVDKARVLQLTAAPEAEAVAKQKTGKTAFFASLPGEVKYNALRAWQRERDTVGSDDSEMSPTRDQLMKHALINGTPMIGFGFMDNFLMILFGGAIDAKLGIYVSTMAAAGLGNMLSNIFGLGVADYIENGCTRFGLPDPNLSTSQRSMLSARTAGVSGTMMGVVVGCILGMFPLLFMTPDKADNSKISKALQE